MSGRRRHQRAVCEVLVVLALVGALVAEWQLFPDSSGAARDPDIATAAAPGGERPRVMIVGDSIADQFGSHALPALEQAGVDVRLATWWGWGLLTREQYDLGATNPDPPENSMMADVTVAVEEFDPDVVALYVNHNYWPPYPRDAAGDEIASGSPAFRAMVHAQLTELMPRLTAGGARVYLIKPVPGRDGPAERNPIWSSYLDLRAELGFGVITAGDVLATASGEKLHHTTDCTGRSVPVRAPDNLHLSYVGAGLLGTRVARSLADVVGVSLSGGTAATEAPAALVPVASGYRLVTCDGSTFRGVQTGRSLGGARFDGARDPGDPVVGAAAAPGGGERGWVVTRSGQVGALGAARRHGDVVDLAPWDEAVGIVATASGRGYWVVTAHGDVHGFGDADQLGTPAGELADGESVVDVAGTADRRGYWLLTSTGRVAAFGSARRLGDLHGAPSPVAPPVAITAQANGEGYWILDRAGNVHPFGSAGQHGSATGAPQDMIRITGWQYPDGDFQTEPVPAAQADPVVATALLSSPSGGGYWVLLANGAVCHFGDAAVLGGVHRAELDYTMRLHGLPLYNRGPCTQLPGDVLAPPEQAYVPTTG